LQNRTARIRIGEYLGREIKLLSGVPQGGCLSPTLFNFYTSDIPDAEGQSLNLIYADDVTQIVCSPGTENMLALKTAREIENINKYENKWKIQTNKTKFLIIPIGRNKTKKVKVGQTEYDMGTEGRMLGLKITKQGFLSHVTDRVTSARRELGSLYRFKDLSPHNKRKLYLALVRSKLVYPIVPLHTLSFTQLRKLQVVQNRAARFINNIRYPDIVSNRIANDRAELTPLNTVLHKQANRIWEKLDDYISDRVKQILTKHEDRTEHRLFPSSRNKAIGPPPEPIY
jgi:hypothetical protein